MLAPVLAPRRSIKEHRPYVGDDTIDELTKIAEPLRGLRVLNLSVSPFGTGTSEQLKSIVPLMRDLGIEAEWQVTGCDEEFGIAARIVYEGLSGRQVKWTPEAMASWQRFNDVVASQFDSSYDVVIVHDPQPAGLPAVLAELNWRRESCRWVLHSHLDMRRAQLDLYENFVALLQHYDAWIVEDPSFAPDARCSLPLTVIPPALDPTSTRNLSLPKSTIRQLLERQGIDTSHPSVLQVASFDPAFSPAGAVDAYRAAKREIPNLQLVLVHPMAYGSPDEWMRFERVARYAKSDPDIHMLICNGDSGQLLVNAAQRAATVVIQRSVPAGFAASVWEAQWKGSPVITGTTGALPIQVIDCLTGYVAEDDKGFAQRVIELITDPLRRAFISGAAKGIVQRRHLITRVLADELSLLQALVGSTPVPIGAKEVYCHV